MSGSELEDTFLSKSSGVNRESILCHMQSGQPIGLQQLRQCKRDGEGMG